MARVLVTGASGFIGSQLAARLVDGGDDVTCLVRPTSKLAAIAPLDVRLARGDVRNPGSLALAVQHTDIVYHVAGIAAAFHPAELVEVNTTGFHNVVTVCAACTTPPTLVFVSSLAAAGPSPPTGRGSRAIRRRPSRTTADPSVTPN